MSPTTLARPEVTAFLEVIAADPSDTTTMLVYADWLLEHGDQWQSACYRLAAKDGCPSWYEIGNLLGLAAGWASHCTWPELPRRGQDEAPAHFAQRLLWTVKQALPVIKRADAKARQEAAWLEAAQNGDAQALLQHPQSRAALQDLVNGRKRGRHARTATDYTSSRKAIAAAKAVLVAREERRAAREDAERASRGVAGGYANAWRAKLHARAVALGEEYHRTVKALYQSKYGAVLYGRGGQETSDRDRYSKGWHSSFGAASNLNAGARLDNEERPTCVILENFRGTEVARLPLKGGATTGG